MKDTATGLGLVLVLLGLVFIDPLWLLVAFGVVAVAWGLTGSEEG